MRYYEVKFDTKKGNPISWIIHVEAKNRKDAIHYAKMMWVEDDRLNGMHMFHVSVRMLKDTEEFKYHYFTVVEA